MIGYTVFSTELYPHAVIIFGLSEDDQEIIPIVERFEGDLATAFSDDFM